MAVVIETTIGDLTVDLFIQERPQACLNFLKLCKLRYYNFNLFHTIEHGFIAQTGDPTGVGNGGESVWGVIEGRQKRFFQAEYQPKIRHTEPGLLSMVSLGDQLIGGQFFLTLGDNLTSLDDTHCVIGQVTEGHDVLRTLNDAICDGNHRPYKDIRITHTVILADPFANPRGFREPSRSPSPSAERLRGGRIGADEDIDDTAGKTDQEVNEMLQDREAKARANILEIVGDLPDAEMAPPENVLFVCKLNPVTSDEDLEIIFSRFGKVKGCEVIRDRVSGDSLQYAFVEFEDAKTCETAYFKMDNVLIDDRRIHVDFSQSVAKVQWKGKGRGLVLKDGQKNNRLNFSDLKGIKGGGGGGGENRPRQMNDRNREHERNNRASSPQDRNRRTANENRDRNDHRRDFMEKSQNNSRIRRDRSRSRDNRRHRSRSREQIQRRDRSADRRRGGHRSRSREDPRQRQRPLSISPPTNQRRMTRRSRSNSRSRASDLSTNRHRRRDDEPQQRGGREEKSKKQRSSSSDDKPRKKVKKTKKKNKKKSKKSKKAASSSDDSSSSSD